MSPVRQSASWDTVRAYIELTKPRIIELLLITTVPAMAVAADGWPGIGLIVVALVGGALSAGGANVINQVYDEDIDRHMRRTAGRPLPTERLGRRGATVFGVLLGIAGSVVLTVGATLTAGVLAAVAFLFYVFVYTMLLKRSTTQNIVLGGAAGAVPALIGWAAVADGLAAAAWLMFAVIFFWTPPHFWALSLKYEDDYRAAGVPMLPVVAGERPTFDLIVWYSLVTVGMSLLLVPVAGLGWIYALVAVVAAVGMVGYALPLRTDRSRSMRYFGFTNVYLAAVFLAMLVDRVVLDSPIRGESAWRIAGSVFALVGIAMVVTVERGRGMRAPGVSPLRHALEVGITVAFTIAMVAVAWVATL